MLLLWIQRRDRVRPFPGSDGVPEESRGLRLLDEVSGIAEGEEVRVVGREVMDGRGDGKRLEVVRSVCCG